MNFILIGALAYWLVRTANKPPAQITITVPPQNKVPDPSGINFDRLRAL